MQFNSPYRTTSFSLNVAIPDLITEGKRKLVEKKKNKKNTCDELENSHLIRAIFCPAANRQFHGKKNVSRSATLEAACLSIETEAMEALLHCQFCNPELEP